MKCATMNVVRNGSTVRINVEDYNPESDSIPGETPAAAKVGSGEGQASATPEPNAKPAETGGEGVKPATQAATAKASAPGSLPTGKAGK